MEKKENNVLVNAITGLSLIKFDGQLRYRVSVRNSFKDYRKDADGNVKLISTNNFLANTRVIHGIIADKLPYVNYLLGKAVEAFNADPANPIIAGYVKVIDDKPVFDKSAFLNMLLKDTFIKMEFVFHAAGEIQTLDDGSEIEHKMDKFNITIVDAEYNPTLASRAEAYKAAEAAKQAAFASMIAALDGFDL